ncbi:MAG: hypothetical protein KBS81_09330 [Spirochaetales bacterium]|nr:hypothetical protein [Candidatus Physcosoma equi]
MVSNKNAMSLRGETGNFMKISEISGWLFNYLLVDTEESATQKELGPERQLAYFVLFLL